MTKRGPWRAGEVGDSSAPDGPAASAAGDGASEAEARAADLLAQWHSHHDDRPTPDRVPRGAHASDVPADRATDGRDALPPVEATTEPDTRPDATVSTLDEIRARLRGRAEPEAPMAQPIPLRVATPAAAGPVVPPEPADPAGIPPPPEPAGPTRPGGAPGTPSAPPKHASGRSPKHAAPRRVVIPENRSTDSVSASRDVVGALGGSPPPEPADRRGNDTDDQVGAATRSSSREQARASAPVVGRSLNVEFPPKLGARRLLGILLLAAIAATCVAGYLAYDEQSTLNLGLAGTLLAVTLALYAVRAGSSTTRLAIRSGQLVVTRGKNKETFDLTSRFTRIEVVGKPGRLGWKVLLGRFGKEPLVITSSVVDPRAFTAELARYRPHD